MPRRVDKDQTLPPDAVSYVEDTVKRYSTLVNTTPGLLSLLYDIDLLPEQLLHVLRHNPKAAPINAARMAAVCELWQRQAQSATAPPT